jgi:hypothetical protein
VLKVAVPRIKGGMTSERGGPGCGIIKDGADFASASSEYGKMAENRNQFFAFDDTPAYRELSSPF